MYIYILICSQQCHSGIKKKCHYAIPMIGNYPKLMVVVIVTISPFPKYISKLLLCQLYMYTYPLYPK